jgi:hypothetical protein
MSYDDEDVYGTSLRSSKILKVKVCDADAYFELMAMGYWIVFYNPFPTNH